MFTTRNTLIFNSYRFQLQSPVSARHCRIKTGQQEPANFHFFRAKKFATGMPCKTGVGLDPKGCPPTGAVGWLPSDPCAAVGLGLPLGPPAGRGMSGKGMDRGREC